MNNEKNMEKFKKQLRPYDIVILLTYLTLMILLSAITSYGQKTDSIAYKTVESYTWVNGKEGPIYMPGLIFEFKEDHIISSVKDQTKNLYMRYPWKDRTLEVGGKPMPGKVVEAYDNGGFKCLINYAYDEDTELYILSVLYDNVVHIHFMEPTTKEARPEIITPMRNGDPINVKYTEEDIKWFWKSFSFLWGDYVSLNWLD